jgi:type IV secretion system protein VirB2
MNIIPNLKRGDNLRHASRAAKSNQLISKGQSTLFWSIALLSAIFISLALPEPTYAQNLETFASNVRGLLSSTLLRTLAVIAVIVTGLLWFTGRASTAVLVTVIIGIAIVFSADSIVGLIAG